MASTTSFQQVVGQAARDLAASADNFLHLSSSEQQGQASSWSKLLFLVPLLLLGFLATRFRNRHSKKNYPPGVPGGLPLLGNLLQLKSLKPHRTLTDLSETYGPIMQLDVGPFKYVVISTPELAKEGAVTKFDSISKRRLLSNLQVWSKGKHIVALADYDDEYRKMKKLMGSRVLGSLPQKSMRSIREQLLETVLDGHLGEMSKGSETVLNIRESIKHYLFPFVMHQILGYVPKGVYVEGMGDLGLWDIFVHLVSNPMKSAITVDWRDFVPLLNWVPNRSFEEKIVEVERTQRSVVKALIEQKRRKLESEGPTGGFLEHMITAEKDLTSSQVEDLAWEPIVEGSDTTLVTAEWAIYQMAKHQDLQERLYQEIKKVVGSRKVVESDLPNLPFLEAIFKETLRYHTPITLLPPREVQEDITLGGYDIPKGWQLLVNVYAINNDKTRWEKWDQFIPDRFLNAPELDMGVNDFQLIPFGLGKRRCAGALQATTIVNSYVASFVQRFHCSLSEKEELTVLEDEGYLTAQKLYPLEVIARPRN